MEYVLGAYKRFNNRRHNPSARKYWHVYYLDNEFKMHNERCSGFKAWWYNREKCRIVKMPCLDCGEVGRYLQKKGGDEPTICPRCQPKYEEFED